MAWTDQSPSRVSHVWETENIRPGRGFSGLMYDRWAAAGALTRNIWASRLLSRRRRGGAERMRGEEGGGAIAGPNCKKEENTPLFSLLDGEALGHLGAPGRLRCCGARHQDYESTDTIVLFHLQLIHERWSQLPLTPTTTANFFGGHVAPRMCVFI